MIPLTDGQITYFSLVVGFILFILALYVIEKWTKKEAWTLREKIIVPPTCHKYTFSNEQSFHC